MTLVMKSGKLKRLMGFNAHQGGFEVVNSSRLAECGCLHEIEADDILLVCLRERLEVPWNYALE